MVDRIWSVEDKNDCFNLEMASNISSAGKKIGGKKGVRR